MLKEQRRQYIKQHRERNPGVPENFDNLYTTFLQQLHGRSHFRSESLNEESRNAIMVLERVINKLGYKQMFNFNYIEDMKYLAIEENAISTDLVYRKSNIPVLKKQAGEDYIKAKANLELTKTNHKESAVLDIRANIISHMILKKYNYDLVAKKEVPIANVISDMELYLQKDKRILDEIADSGLDKILTSRLERIYESLTEKIKKPLTPELFVEIYEFDDLIGVYDRKEYLSQKPQDLETEKNMIEDMIKEQSGVKKAPEGYQNMSIEQKIYENWELENALFLKMKSFSPDLLKSLFEEVIDKNVRLSDDQMQAESKLSLIKNHLRLLDIENYYIGKILKTRRNYGPQWKEALSRFREIEKEVFIAWGKEMIAEGHQHPYLQFGMRKGYF